MRHELDLSRIYQLFISRITMYSICVIKAALMEPASPSLDINLIRRCQSLEGVATTLGCNSVKTASQRLIAESILSTADTAHGAGSSQSSLKADSSLLWLRTLRILPIVLFQPYLFVLPLSNKPLG